MAVFQYQAVNQNNTEHHEHGVVVASDKLQAWDKLARRSLKDIKLKRVDGLRAFFLKLRAEG